MRIDTRKRKNAMIGLRQISGEQQMLSTLFRVINRGKAALDEVMLDMGRTVAESIMLIENKNDVILAALEKGLKLMPKARK